MTYRPATMLLTLAMQACAAQVPVAVECPVLPAPPKALAPALPPGPTPLLDAWQNSKQEWLRSLNQGTVK